MFERMCTPSRTSIAAAACLALLQAPYTRAEEPPPPEETSGRGLAIVVSGGVSQGAYQAGQLWYLDRLLHPKLTDPADPGSPPLILTGASAGAVNSLLMAVSQSTYDDLNAPPSESLYFRTWIPMGFSGDKESLDNWAAGDGLISSVAIEGMIEGLDQHWRAAYLARPAHPHPEIRLGVQATRFVPSPEHRAPWTSAADTVDRFDPPYQSNEAFGFQLSAPSLDGIQHRLTLYPLYLACPGGEGEDCDLETARLERRAGPISPRRVGDLVRASGAFPLAFNPVSIPCSDYRGAAFWPDRPCDDAQSLLLFDGGLYENNPVRLAYELTRGMGEEGAAPGDAKAQPYLYIYLDPDLRQSLWDTTAPPWEWRSVAEGDRAAQRAQVIEMFIGTLRNQAVADFLRDHQTNQGPDVGGDHLSGPGNDLWAVPTRLPPAGSYLGAFLGFFDRSLRIWDFYAGMHDMMAFLKVPLTQPGQESSPFWPRALTSEPLFMRFERAALVAEADPCLNPRVWNARPAAPPPDALLRRCEAGSSGIPSGSEEVRRRLDEIIDASEHFPPWSDVESDVGLMENLDRLIDIPLIRGRVSGQAVVPHACWGTHRTWGIKEPEWDEARDLGRCPRDPEARARARQSMYGNLKLLTHLGLYRSAGALGETGAEEADDAWILDALSDRDAFHPGDLAVTRRMNLERAVRIQLLRLLERGFEQGTLPSPEPGQNAFQRINPANTSTAEKVSLRVRETLWPRRLEFTLEARADTTDGIQPALALGGAYFLRTPMTWLRWSLPSFSVAPELRQGEGLGLALTWQPMLDLQIGLPGGLKEILRPIGLRAYPWARYETLWPVAGPGLQRIGAGLGMRLQLLQWFYVGLEVSRWEHVLTPDSAGVTLRWDEAPWRLSLGWVLPPDTGWKKNRRWPNLSGEQSSFWNDRDGDGIPEPPPSDGSEGGGEGEEADPFEE